MAYRSPYTGTQVTTAIKYMLHPQIGVVLTFDSSSEFPDLSNDLENLTGKEKAYYTEREDASGNVVSPEFYKRAVYVDSSDNIMYRWSFITQEAWLEDHDDLSTYPESGWTFVPISGKGGGDLYWNPIA